MNVLTDLFDQLLDSHGSVDFAEAEFKRMISDDPELRADYRLWCQDNGHTERYGFLDYAEEFIDMQNSVWDSLTDYDNSYS
jgi:hypothetical protein